MPSQSATITFQGIYAPAPTVHSRQSLKAARLFHYHQNDRFVTLNKVKGLSVFRSTAVAKHFSESDGIPYIPCGLQ